MRCGAGSGLRFILRGRCSSNRGGTHWLVHLFRATRPTSRFLARSPAETKQVLDQPNLKALLVFIFMLLLALLPCFPVNPFSSTTIVVWSLPISFSLLTLITPIQLSLLCCTTEMSSPDNCRDKREGYAIRKCS